MYLSKCLVLLELNTLNNFRTVCNNKWQNLSVIVKKFKISFFPDKMPRKVMNSMNYEYDYFSIMHYGTKFFSKNGKATIKIRKRGRNIGAKIGQRKGLSWIDVAQVHAMYNCNKIPSEESGKLSKVMAGYKITLLY